MYIWFKKIETLIISNWGIFFATLFSFLIVLVSFDSYWYGVDEGIHAHLADQLNRGLIYGVEIFDIHAGYQIFLDAWLFNVFGRDMTVLLYPFILIETIQSFLIAYLFRGSGQKVAFLMGCASPLLGFLVFPDPSPNWYALFFAVVAFFCVSEIKYIVLRNGILGVLLGTMLMFRHPSAIFLGLGILCMYIYEDRLSAQDKSPSWLSKILLSLILVSLILYLCLVFEVTTFLILGLCPLLVVLSMFLYVRTDNEILFKKIFVTSLGFIAAILPMLLYQILYGDIRSWFYESFIVGAKIAGFEFFSEIKYVSYVFTGFDYTSSTLMNFSVSLLLGVYWIFLLVFPILLGFLTLKKVTRQKNIPLGVFLSLTYVYISIYYQWYVYYSYSFILVVIALGFMLDKPKRLFFASIACSLGVVGWFYQAGSSPLFVYSQNIPSTVPELKRNISPYENNLYTQIFETINEHSNDGDPIFVFPMNPEIYFLSGRVNNFPFYGTSFHITSEPKYKKLLDDLTLEEVRLVIFNDNHAFTNEFDLRLAEWLHTGGNFTLVKQIENFLIFKRND